MFVDIVTVYMRLCGDRCCWSEPSQPDFTHCMWNDSLTSMNNNSNSVPEGWVGGKKSVLFMTVSSLSLRYNIVPLSVCLNVSTIHLESRVQCVRKAHTDHSSTYVSLGAIRDPTSAFVCFEHTMHYSRVGESNVIYNVGSQPHFFFYVFTISLVTC